MKRGMTPDEVDDDISEFGTAGAPWRIIVMPTYAPDPAEERAAATLWVNRPGRNQGKSDAVRRALAQIRKDQQP